MFISTYLPVNMHRTNCAVYSSEKVFPEEKLLKAYSFVTGHAVEGVEWNDGNVVFLGKIKEICIEHFVVFVKRIESKGFIRAGVNNDTGNVENVANLNRTPDGANVCTVGCVIMIF